MEKVFLRVYNREIESMIEGGKLDEAVAHCQHILQAFPMHVETYRLLGKAFLEDRRYPDAADIFQRVLLAVPDDFMAHLGMSIIRDDQGRLNDAIWHMERALEIQPSNSAIQNELRRLYGRRDGVETSKIRLGRDALANMYSQGELFPQAIAEFRSLLAEDPNRPDLQVMLMRACYRSGQKGEAKEIATTLLKKYPYCMDALRILVDIFHDTTKAENIPVFRHRLFMLDPYSSFSLESAFASDQVADSAVSLERLDYKPGMVSGSSQPDWTSSLGIKLDSERFGPRTASAIDAGVVPSPDWMRPVGWIDNSREIKGGSADTVGLQPATPIAKADLPEWLMLEDPTMNNQEKNQEPELPSENPQEGVPGGEDDIPDWLKSIYPSKVPEDTQKESQEWGDSSPLGGDIDDKHITPPSVPIRAPEKTRESIESLPAGDSDIPDWLKPITPLAANGEEIIKPDEHAESQLANGEDLPGFLKSMTQEEDVEKPSIEPQTPEKPLTIDGEEVPGFLSPISPAKTAEEGLLASPVNEEPQPKEIKEGPEYFDTRVSAEAADTSRVVSEPVLPEETILKSGSEPAAEAASSPAGEAFPDWMREIVASEAAAVPPAVQPIEKAPTTEQVVSEQPVTEQPVTEPPASEEPIVEQAVIEQAVPEQPVLEQPAIEQALPAQPDLVGSTGQEVVEPTVAESGTIPQDRPAEIPEWLEEPGEKPVEALASSSDQPIAEAIPEEGEKPVSEALSETAAKTAAEPVGGEADTLIWLERLSADQGPTKEEALVSPEGSQGTTSEVGQEIAGVQPVVQAMEETVPAPSLVVEMAEEAQSKPPVEPTGEEKPAVAEEEFPEWLKGLEDRSGLGETPKAVEDVPEPQRLLTPTMEPESPSSIPEEPIWEDENIPVTGQAVPTTPEEWVPAESKEIAEPEFGTTPESNTVDEALLASIPGPISETIQVSKPEPPVEPAPVAESEPTSEIKPFEKTEPAPEPTPISTSGTTPVITPSSVPEHAEESAPVFEAEPAIETTPVSEPVLPVVQDLKQPEAIRQIDMLPSAPSQEQDSDLLASAQALLAEDSFDESMKQYSRLIKKGHLLADVTKDLREATHHHPAEVNIWQTLGDAYMRANRLEDALDAYSKGEELLR